MSAIGGLVYFDERRPEPAILERMQAALAPYGRDAQAIRISGQAAMLRNLLRTTPEDSLDVQPLVHKSSGVLMTFDGRLDNRDELAESLSIRPGEVRMMSDSDLALRACLQWNEDAVSRMLGDFAIACFTSRDRKLWLARDPMGQRPLYWHHRSDRFAFATMPKGLLTVPGIPKAVCQATLHDFMCLLPMTGSESFFKDIHRVQPGQIVTVKDGRLEKRQFHRFDAKRELRLGSDEAYVEALQAEIQRSVACRLRSSQKVASQLSSGLDSGTVSATAANLLEKDGKSLMAYTAVPRAGFDGPIPPNWHGDEGPAAQALAAMYPNIKHRLVRTTGTSPIDGLEGAVEAMDRPPLNLCNLVWVRAIENQAVKDGARVILTGTKGNASISYTGLPRLPQLLIRGKWLNWLQEVTALHKKDRRFGRRRLVLQSIGPYLPAFAWRHLAKRSGMVWTLQDYCPAAPEFLERMQSRWRLPRGGRDPHLRPWSNGGKMRIHMLTGTDMGDYNAATNVAGLEARDPTADVRLVEFCLAVPEGQYLRDGQISWLLRRAMQGRLPKDILDSQSKGYQSADWYEALGASLPGVSDTIAGLRRDGIDRYLDLEQLETSLADWPAGDWEQPGKNERRFRIKMLRGLSAGAFAQKTEPSNR